MESVSPTSLMKRQVISDSLVFTRGMGYFIPTFKRMIGGQDPGDANTITNAYTDTIYYFEDHNYDGCVRADVYSHVTVLNNVTLCNAYHGSAILDDNPSIFLGPMYVRIDSTGIGFVREKATPNTHVDVYLDEEASQHPPAYMSGASTIWM